jgi:hypothetical protein
VVVGQALPDLHSRDPVYQDLPRTGVVVVVVAVWY